MITTISWIWSILIMIGGMVASFATNGGISVGPYSAGAIVIIAVGIMLEDAVEQIKKELKAKPNESDISGR